jgi:hypothetical protein
MNRKVNPSLALAVGLLGGLLSRYIVLTPVLAQPAAPRQIIAQSFILVDSKNNIVGVFKPSPKSDQPPTVVLLDQNGREIWRAGVRDQVLTER